MSIIQKAVHVGLVSVLVLGSGLTIAGCSAGDAADSAASVTSEALGITGLVYGSDTLKPVVVSPYLPLVYAGTGSGVGEACLRGSAPCAPNKQLAAPMSRDIAGSCSVGGDDLKSFRIGLDGILALTPTTNSATNITTADLAKAFCAAPTPPAANPACPSSITVGGVTYDKFYRRDDLSGTTDTLKTLLGCTSLCNNASHTIIDASTRPSPCLSTDSDTQCIAKLTQANTGAGSGNFVLSYAGLSALTVPVANRPKPLDVNSVTPSDTTIRNRSYPLSRDLYVNYNETTLGAPAGTDATANEKKFLCENVLGPAFIVGTDGCSTIPGLVDRRTTFENSLVSLGDFVKCDPSNLLNCSTVGLKCP